MAMTLFGMAPKKAAVFVLITGGTATVTKFAGDAIGDRLFVQSTADATAHPRDADAQKMVQLYRGLAVGAGGVFLGKMLYKYTRPVAIGIAAGAVVSGLDRILTVYDVKRQVKNLFLASNAQIAAPAANTVPQYNAGSLRLPQSSRTTGPMVMRDRVAMAG